MLDRKTIAPLGSEGGPIEEFAVLGATANGAVLPHLNINSVYKKVMQVLDLKPSHCTHWGVVGRSVSSARGPAPSLHLSRRRQGQLMQALLVRDDPSAAPGPE